MIELERAHTETATATNETAAGAAATTETDDNVHDRPTSAMTAAGTAVAREIADGEGRFRIEIDGETGRMSGIEAERTRTTLVVGGGLGREAARATRDTGGMEGEVCTVIASAWREG